MSISNCFSAFGIQFKEDFIYDQIPHKSLNGDKKNFTFFKEHSIVSIYNYFSAFVIQFKDDFVNDQIP